jgi:hypothetical protein
METSVDRAFKLSYHSTTKQPYVDGINHVTTHSSCGINLLQLQGKTTYNRSDMDSNFRYDIYTWLSSTQ